MALLEIENLVVRIPDGSGPFRAVDGVSLKVHEGEVLAIVGESGSGNPCPCCRHGASALDRQGDRGQARLQRTGSIEDAASDRAQDRREGHRDDLSGAHRQPQSVLHRSVSRSRSAAHTYGPRPGSAAATAPSSCSMLGGIPDPASASGTFRTRCRAGVQRVMIANRACLPTRNCSSRTSRRPHWT